MPALAAPSSETQNWRDCRGLVHTSLRTPFLACLSVWREGSPAQRLSQETPILCLIFQSAALDALPLPSLSHGETQHSLRLRKQEFPNLWASSCSWKLCRRVRNRGSGVRRSIMRSPGLGAPKLPDIPILGWVTGVRNRVGVCRLRMRGMGNSGLAVVASLGVQRVLLREV